MPIWFLALAWMLGVNVGHATTYYEASLSGTDWTSYTGADGTGSNSTPPTRAGRGNLTFAALASGGPGLSVSAGNADFSNNGVDPYVNTISGGIILSGGSSRANFHNKGSGTATNTIDIININNGALYLGGRGSTTNIDTLNWNGGTLRLVYSNGSFGNTHVNNLNVTASVTLTLWDSDSWEALTTSTGQYTLFTFDNFTGNAHNITLNNTHSTLEVTGEPRSSGITFSGSTATINFAPAASAHNPVDIETIQSPTDMPVTMITNEIANQFAPTPHQKAEASTRIQKALQQQRGRDSFENLVTALSEGGDAAKFVKINGDYRVFAAPYATVTRNNGDGSPLKWIIL